MLDHLSLQVADVGASVAFYTTVFAPVGMHEVMRFDREGSLVVGLAGPDGRPGFWLGPAAGPAAREVHVAFTAPGTVHLVDRLDAGALDALEEEHTASGAHRAIRIAFPGWVPPGVLRSAEAMSEDDALAQLPEWLRGTVIRDRRPD